MIKSRTLRWIGHVARVEDGRSPFKIFNKSNIIRVMKCGRLRWAGHVATMNEGRSAFKILTGTPTRKRWEHNIRMDLKEIGINTRNWVDLTQDRNYWRALVNAALNFRVP